MGRESKLDQLLREYGEAHKKLGEASQAVLAARTVAEAATADVEKADRLVQQEFQGVKAEARMRARGEIL